MPPVKLTPKVKERVVEVYGLVEYVPPSPRDHFGRNGRVVF
jgi:hypothetical protein